MPPTVVVVKPKNFATVSKWRYSCATMPNRLRNRFLMATLLLFTACAKQELLHELEEREANEIVVLLDSNHIPCSKVLDAEGAGGGNKGPRFKIAVAASDANAAWKILTDHQLPRRKDTGYAEVFASSGLVPTASEEKAKMLTASQGEIARTLKSIDGILDARVHIVVPEDSILKVRDDEKTKATASVWFKYIARNGKPPVTEAQIADLVANSVEKLRPDQVKVIGTTAGNAEISPEAAAAADMVKLLGVNVAKSDAGRLKLILAAAVLIMVLLAAGFTWGMYKASTAAAVQPRRPGPPARPPEPQV